MTTSKLYLVVALILAGFSCLLAAMFYKEWDYNIPSFWVGILMIGIAFGLTVKKK